MIRSIGTARTLVVSPTMKLQFNRRAIYIAARFDHGAARNLQHDKAEELSAYPNEWQAGIWTLWAKNKSHVLALIICTKTKRSRLAFMDVVLSTTY